MSNYFEDNREEFNRIVNSSIYGNRSSSHEVDYISREKYELMRDRWRDRAKKRFTAGLLAGVIAASGIFGVGTAVKNFVSDENHERVARSDVGDAVHDFHLDVIAPNTYRVDNKNYAYDYEAIAEALETYGSKNFDINVYLCLQDLGAEQMSKVLDVAQDGKYKLMLKDEDGNEVTRSLRNYLNEKRFFEEGTEITDDKAYGNALNEFEDSMFSLYVIEDSVRQVQEKYNSDQAELNQIMEDHDLDPIESDIKTKGGI